MKRLFLKMLGGAIALTVYSGTAMANDCVIKGSPAIPAIIEDLLRIPPIAGRDAVAAIPDRACTVDEAVHAEKIDRESNDINLNNLIITNHEQNLTADNDLDARIDAEKEASEQRDLVEAQTRLTNDGLQDQQTIDESNASKSRDEAEAEARSEADDDLGALMTTEKADRETVDGQLDLRIDTERADSIARDNEEASARSDADNDLGDLITTEKQDRETADTNIREDMADIEGTTTKNTTAIELNRATSHDNSVNLELESQEREGADFVINNKIGIKENESKERDAALGVRIDTEETARTSADDALGTRIDTERTASISRDNALGVRIDDETLARINADEGLSSRIKENEEAIEDAIALSVAIPDSYLSPGKNFSLALGGGFTDGSAAFGGIGTLRFSENFTAYGGGSGLVDGGTWAAKGGARLEW